MRAKQRAKQRGREEEEKLRKEGFGAREMKASGSLDAGERAGRGRAKRLVRG